MRRSAVQFLPIVLSALAIAAPAAAQPMVKDVKTLTSAAARRLVDACAAYADARHAALAMVVLDPAGRQLEFHAMEGANESAITTAPMKAKTALRWRQPTSVVAGWVSSGENLAPVWVGDLPMAGALPIFIEGQLVGAMGVSSAQGEACAQAAIDAVLNGAATSP